MKIKNVLTSYILLPLLWFALIIFSFQGFAQDKKDALSATYTTKDTALNIKDSLKGVAKMDTGKLAYSSVQDSVLDTIIVKPQPYQPIPKKAGLYSAILPGLGQAYNHQVWKVPIIYAGLFIAGYFLKTDLDYYQTFRKAYIGRINNPLYSDQFDGIYSEVQLQQLQNDYSKYLDMTILYTVLGFGMQVIDAIASAHLKNFDVSRDISIKWKPVITTQTYGVGMVLNFK